jgi:hypothetical protein
VAKIIFDFYRKSQKIKPLLTLLLGKQREAIYLCRHNEQLIGAFQILIPEPSKSAKTIDNMKQTLLSDHLSRTPFQHPLTFFTL